MPNMMIIEFHGLEPETDYDFRWLDTAFPGREDSEVKVITSNSRGVLRTVAPVTASKFELLPASGITKILDQRKKGNRRGRRKTDT